MVIYMSGEVSRGLIEKSKRTVQHFRPNYLGDVKETW